jgi:hypothetical protein
MPIAGLIFWPSRATARFARWTTGTRLAGALGEAADAVRHAKQQRLFIEKIPVLVFAANPADVGERGRADLWHVQGTERRVGRHYAKG